MKINVLNEKCTGPNPHCIEAALVGRTVHVHALTNSDELSLVMPDYHFATVQQGIEVVQAAWESAHTIMTDDELLGAQHDRAPYKLPTWWIDPTRRDHPHTSAVPCEECKERKRRLLEG